MEANILISINIKRLYLTLCLGSDLLLWNKSHTFVHYALKVFCVVR
nr:MAG TPA: hypothetical protein [Caudoviricetes sp.]